MSSDEVRNDARLAFRLEFIPYRSSFDVQGDQSFSYETDSPGIGASLGAEFRPDDDRRHRLDVMVNFSPQLLHPTQTFRNQFGRPEENTVFEYQYGVQGDYLYYPFENDVLVVGGTLTVGGQYITTDVLGVGMMGHMVLL